MVRNRKVVQIYVSFLSSALLILHLTPVIVEDTWTWRPELVSTVNIARTSPDYKPSTNNHDVNNPQFSHYNTGL